MDTAKDNDSDWEIVDSPDKDFGDFGDSDSDDYTKPYYSAKSATRTKIKGTTTRGNRIQAAEIKTSYKVGKIEVGKSPCE